MYLLPQLLALQLPDGRTINSLVQTGANTPISEASLGGVISGLLNIAFYIGGFMVIVWMTWGSFQYIFSAGNKDALSKARSRITWALVGLVILILSFGISQYVQYVFLPAREFDRSTQISEPPPLPGRVP